VTRLLTTAETAERLRKSPMFIRREFRRGNLRGSKFGGELHFADADIEAYIASHFNVQPLPQRRKRRVS
jgi:excisionase family DNA binding protein